MRVRSVDSPAKFCDFSTDRTLTRVDIDPPDLPSGWVHNDILGFEVFLSPTLAGQGELATTALNLLREQLAHALALLPADTHIHLREARFWLDTDERAIGFPLAMMPPSFSDYAAFHGAMARGILIGNFADYNRRHRSSTALIGPLSYIYRFQVLGYWNPAIKQAFEDANRKGLYRNVQTQYGIVRPVGSAMRGPGAYFEKLTRAYFGTSDEYPFDRASLEQYDPDGFRFVSKAWAGELGSIAPIQTVICRLN